MSNYSSIQNEKDAVSPIYSLSQFISDLKVVEEIYFDLEDDKDLKNTCTRIRVHYYGHARKINYSSFNNFAKTKVLGIIFSNAIPKAKYKIKNGAFLRILDSGRFAVKNKKDVYERLTSQVFDDFGPNPSPFIIHNGNQIDLGQILYGFESLVYQKDLGDYTENPTYQEPDPNNPDKTYSDSYNSIPLRRINDLTGWVANIATPVAEVLQHHINGESRFKGQNNAPNSAYGDRDRYYEISAPDSDLFANADAIGVYYAYKKLVQYSMDKNSEKPRLSDVFELYYTGKSRLKFKEDAIFIPDAPIPMPHTVERRWLIFSIHFGFTHYKGLNTFQWIPTSENWVEFLNETTKQSNDENHKSLNERLTLFAEFWASTNLLFYGQGNDKGSKHKVQKIRRGLIATDMANNLDPFKFPFYVKPFTKIINIDIFRFQIENDMLYEIDLLNINNDVKYFLETKFLPWLRAKVLETPAIRFTFNE